MKNIEEELQEIVLEEKKKAEIKLIIINWCWYSTSHLYDEKTYREMFESLSVDDVISFISQYQENPYFQNDIPYTENEIISAFNDLKILYSKTNEENEY